MGIFLRGKISGVLVAFCLLFGKTVGANCFYNYEKFVANFKMTQEEARELKGDMEAALKGAKGSKKIYLTNTAVMRWKRNLYVRAKELIREVEGRTMTEVELNRLSKQVKIPKDKLKDFLKHHNKKRFFCPLGESPADYNEIVLFVHASLNS